MSSLSGTELADISKVMYGPGIINFVCSCEVYIVTGILEGIVSTLRVSYPQLKTNYVPSQNSAWVVLHRLEMVVTSD